MQALVVSAPGDYNVERVPDPAPAVGELVVAVQSTGLCGTDLHLIDGDLPYDSYPVVPGHEFFGEVVEVGADVDRARLGRIVAVDPNLPCRMCEECRRGRTNLCLSYAALGVTLDGGCAEYVRVPAQLAYDVTPGTPSAASQLIEPLACAVHGFDVLPRYPADRYLIYGAGPMGLLMGLLAAELSSESVSIVEPNARRRAFAETLGFNAVATPDEFEVDRRWESVIDCSGSPAAIEDGLSRIRRGGSFQCFGVAQPEALVKVRPFDIYRNEITIAGSMAVLNSFSTACRLAERWGNRLTPLVTDRFSLEEFDQALAAFRAGSSLKTAIYPTRARLQGAEA